MRVIIEGYSGEAKEGGQREMKFWAAFLFCFAFVSPQNKKSVIYFFLLDGSGSGHLALHSYYPPCLCLFLLAMCTRPSSASLSSSSFLSRNLHRFCLPWMSTTTKESKWKGREMVQEYDVSFPWSWQKWQTTGLVLSLRGPTYLRGQKKREIKYRKVGGGVEHWKRSKERAWPEWSFSVPKT